MNFPKKCTVVQFYIKPSKCFELLQLKKWFETKIQFSKRTHLKPGCQTILREPNIDFVLSECFEFSPHRNMMLQIDPSQLSVIEISVSLEISDSWKNRRTVFGWTLLTLGFEIHNIHSQRFQCLGFFLSDLVTVFGFYIFVSNLGNVFRFRILVSGIGNVFFIFNFLSQF